MAKLVSELGADVIDDTIVAKKTRFTPKQKNYMIGLPILGVILAAVVTIYVLAANVWLKDFENMSYITYTHSAPDANGNIEYATINRVDPTSNYPETFRVPQTLSVDGKVIKIKRIDDGAFAGCTRLKKVIIPSNVEYIGSQAFAGCKNLATFEFSKNLSYIGNDAFMDTQYQKDWPVDDYIRVNNILLHVGKNALGTKTALVATNESANIDSLLNQGYSVFALDSLTPITSSSQTSSSIEITQWMEGLFSGISSIEYVELPDYLEEIPAKSFMNCKNLETVVVHSNTKSIALETFAGCNKLENVITANSALNSIGDYAFKETSLSQIDLPDSVSTLGVGAFQDVDTIQSVDYPTGLKSVPAYTFDGCENLSSLTFPNPDTIESIGEAAFRGTSFVTFTVPKKVSKISDHTFSNCDLLEKVYVYDDASLNRIDAYAFDGSNSFSALLLLDEEGHVLSTCTDDKTVYLPKTLTSLSAATTASKGGYQFRKTLVEHVVINDKLGSIGEYAFAETPLKSVTFGSNSLLRTIGQYAFTKCANLGPSVILPDTVESIGAYAFNGCTSLVEVHLPQSDNAKYTTVQKYLFNGCTALEKINIPTSVSKISAYAFKDCLSLKEIYIPLTVSTVEEDAFVGCENLIVFAQNTKAPRNWEKGWDNSVNHIAMGSEGKLVDGDFIYSIVKVEDDVLALQLVRYVGDDVNVVIPSSVDGKEVVAVLHNAFLNNETVQSVTIPSTVTIISGTPFMGCTSLTSIVIDQASALEGFEEGFNKTSSSSEVTVTYNA